MDQEDYTHPEKYLRGAYYYPDGQRPPDLPQEFIDSFKGKNIICEPIPDPDSYSGYKELCRSCGWDSYHELCTSYTSRIRVFHAHDNMGLWQIGSQWMIKDQPNDFRQGNDYMTQEFLRSHAETLDVPLIKEMRRLGKLTDQIHYTLMSVVLGVRLDSIWSTLSREQKAGYSEQLGLAIKSWQQFTSTRAEKVDGTQLFDTIIGTCFGVQPPTCAKMGFTRDEWLENLTETLRNGISRIHETTDPAIIEPKLQELKNNFPKCEPYVLTHADLNPSNIIVKDDKIQAIIDWEAAGYMPWWAERYIALAQSSTPGAAQLLDAIWDKADEEIDAATFRKDIKCNVAPLADTWLEAKIEHEPMWDSWVLPVFCECQPHRRAIRNDKIGKPWVHRVETKEEREQEDLEEANNPYWGMPWLNPDRSRKKR